MHEEWHEVPQDTSKDLQVRQCLVLTDGCVALRQHTANGADELADLKIQLQ